MHYVDEKLQKILVQKLIFTIIKLYATFILRLGDFKLCNSTQTYKGKISMNLILDLFFFFKYSHNQRKICSNPSSKILGEALIVKRRAPVCCY